MTIFTDVDPMDEYARKIRQKRNCAILGGIQAVGLTAGTVLCLLFLMFPRAFADSPLLAVMAIGGVAAGAIVSGATIGWIAHLTTGESAIPVDRMLVAMVLIFLLTLVGWVLVPGLTPKR